MVTCRGLCPGGSLSEGSLSPRMVTCGRYASYWNAFLFMYQFNLHRVATTRLIFFPKYFSRASQLMDDFEEMEAMMQDESDVKALK